MRLHLALFLFLCTSNAFACTGLLVEKDGPFEGILLRSSNVVLAKAVKAELKKNGDVLYTFETEKILAGKSENTFQYIGAPESRNSSQETFDNHFDPQFWKEPTIGRLGLGNGDCQMHPGFSVGDSYLLFLNVPNRPKSFELIARMQGDESTKDKWLQYVENHVGRSP